jgi:V8-like Glu-specific endopeptidase
MRPKSLFFTVLCLLTQGSFALAADPQSQSQPQPLSIQLDTPLRSALLQAYQGAEGTYQDQARYGDMGPVLQTEKTPKVPVMDPVQDTLAYPWLYVGQLQIRFGVGQFNGCTGTMIAPKVVLTAAHCFYDPEQGYYQEGKFFAARNGAQLPYQPVAIKSVEYMHSSGPALDNNEDVALVHLESAPYADTFWKSWGSVPVALVTDAHFHPGDARSAMALTVAGYPVKPPSGEDGKLYRSTTLSYRNAESPGKGNQFEHGALSFEGTSGGPIFAYDPVYDTFAMVGVVSSQREWQNGDTWAVGVKLNQTAIDRIHQVMMEDSPSATLTPPILVQLRR